MAKLAKTIYIQLYIWYTYSFKELLNVSGDPTFVNFTRAALVINLGRIADNIRVIRSLTNPDAMVMAVVKDDGYGHGILEVSKAALDAGADWLGVATVKEGQALRDHGIGEPILVLGPVFEEEFEDLLRFGLTSTMFDFESCEKLSQTAQRLEKRAAVHIKIDTGMNRIGYSYMDTDTIIREVTAISQLPNIEIGGIYSHFASSDSDASFTREQFSRFTNVLQVLEDAGQSIPIKHISNSGGVINHPECNLDMVRCGILIYGLAPCSTLEGAANIELLGIKPALTLKSRISQVRTVKMGESVGYGRSYVAKQDIVVATVPIGYAHGISRKHSNNGKALINGQICGIIGTVCMDQLMIDATGSGAKLRDEVVFIGQHGVSAEDVAALQGTNNYEVVTALSLRIPVYYI